jgi:hypothetical protein
MRLNPPPEQPEVPGQFWKDFIRETAPEYRKSTYDQLETVIAPIWGELIGGAKYVDDRLREILDEVQPDVIVEDNVVAFPALVAHGAPWVRIVSCNPLELKDPDLPPTFSGSRSPTAAEWDAFRRDTTELHADMHATSTPSSRSAALRRCRPGSSSTSRRTSTSTSTRRRPTTSARGRSRRPGTTSAPASAAATRRGRCRRRSGAREAHLPQPRVARVGRRGADAALHRPARRGPSTGSSSAWVRSTTSCGWPTTCGAPSSCPSRRSCRTSTWSSRTAATTRSPRPSSTGSR